MTGCSDLEPCDVRLHPAEVHEWMSKDEEVDVIDLRHRHDYQALPEIVPNAVRVPMESIDRHYHRIPKERDIILYCNWLQENFRCSNSREPESMRSCHCAKYSKQAKR